MTAPPLPDVSLLCTPPGLDPVGDYIAELAGADGAARIRAELDAYDTAIAYRARYGIATSAPRGRREGTGYRMRGSELVEKLNLKADGDEALAQLNAVRVIEQLIRTDARGRLMRHHIEAGRALEQCADAIAEALWTLTEGIKRGAP